MDKYRAKLIIIEMQLTGVLGNLLALYQDNRRDYDRGFVTL